MARPPIRDFIDLVNAGLAASGAAPADRLFVGDEALHYNLSPPRVVWTYTEDVIGPPDGFTKGRTKTNRALFSVANGFEVHIWGASEAATEVLRDAFLRALWAEGHGSILLPFTGVWQKLEGGEHAFYGREYVLRIAVHAPVIDADTTVVNPTTMKATLIHKKVDGSDETIAVITKTEP